MIVVLLACATPPALHLPIACTVGEDCWISTRPDVDPGPSFRDHFGGSDTRDGHDGTDVAVRNVGQAVATWVVAPAAATVLRVRDDVPDGELLAAGPSSVNEHECGNGVVLDLGDGWEAQLCHFLSGTVAVAVGDRVEVGAHLGRVGWSGEADHPHVHLTVSHTGREVDPFTGRHLDDGSAAAPRPLWVDRIPDPGAMDALAWAGFDAGPRRADGAWPIDGPRGVVSAAAQSLVLTVFLWRPKEGDTVRVAITAPDGTTTTSDTVQPRDRPRQTWEVEKIWPADERPVGLWTARIEWQRGERKREVRASVVLK